MKFSDGLGKYIFVYISDYLTDLTALSEKYHSHLSGGWFGCHLDYVPINIGVMSSSQLTKSIIFPRGILAHQAVIVLFDNIMIYLPLTIVNL